MENIENTENVENKPKVKVRDEKHIKTTFTDIERYILDSIVNNDRPKIDNCFYHKGQYDLNKCVNKKGTTFLHYAMSSGKDLNHLLIKGNNIIYALVKNGAKVDAFDVDGLTPLDYAQIKGFKNNIEALKFAVQDLHAKGKR